MKQKTRKAKAVSNTVLPTVVNGKDLMVSIERSNRRERPTMDIQSRTSEVDYKQKFEQQKEEIELLKAQFELSSNVYKSQIHRLNSQVGGYKKNLNDAKDTIKALNADVNGLKLIRLNITNSRQSLLRKCEANDVFISQLETDLRISKDNIFNLTNELKSIKSKWWYKLFN